MKTDSCLEALALWLLGVGAFSLLVSFIVLVASC
jgi:hypothetical protein